MDKGLRAVLLLLVSAVVIAFFLPWVEVESQHVGAVSKILTGKKQAAIDSISGFEAPLRANSDEARLAVSVIGIFAPDTQDADKKSFLVFLIPGIAIGIYYLCKNYGKSPFLHLLLCVVALTIFGAGLYKILTTDMDKLILNVKIGSGLWITLAAYLGIGIVEALAFLEQKK